MDTSSLHIFGNLTAKSSSKTISFKTVDADNDGGITETEWEKAARLYKCDTLEFSTLDKDGNGEISEEEFASIQQNVQLQKKLDTLVKKQIAKDFGGIDAEYLPDMIEALKDFALEYAEMHDGEADIAANFEQELLAFYNETKEALLENAPSRIQSRVLDNVYETLVSDSTPKTIKNAIFDEMEKVASDYTKKHYADPNFEKDLEAYLSNYMNTSDVEKMQEAWDKYNEKQASYKEQVDATELERLKNDVEAFLRTALENHIEVKLGSTTIKNVSTITTALKKYKDAEALRADMEAIYESLSRVTKRDEIEIKTCNKATANIAAEIKKEYTTAGNISNNLDYAIKAVLADAKELDSATLNELIANAQEALSAAQETEEEIKALYEAAEELKAQAEETTNAAQAERYVKEAEDLLKAAQEYSEKLSELSSLTMQLINVITTAVSSAKTEVAKAIQYEQDAEKYKGENIGKNLYEEYTSKILLGNTAATSSHLEVINYNLNTDGTINVDSLPAELKIVYKNLQKYTLEYYNSTEAGKDALERLGGEANLQKIIDAAWQNRAIGKSWDIGSAAISLNDFLKSVFKIVEEMIKSIEADNKCLERLTKEEFDVSLDTLAKNLATSTEVMNNNGNTLKGTVQGDTSIMNGAYVPNSLSSAEKNAWITGVVLLRDIFVQKYSWINRTMFYEDFESAQRLAINGLINKNGGRATEVTLEEFLQATAKYFMAYVNQDYRDQTNAQNVKGSDW